MAQPHQIVKRVLQNEKLRTFVQQFLGLSFPFRLRLIMFRFHGEMRSRHIVMPLMSGLA